LAVHPQLLAASADPSQLALVMPGGRRVSLGEVTELAAVRVHYRDQLTRLVGPQLEQRRCPIAAE
jgi:hypothetical protein